MNKKQMKKVAREMATASHTYLLLNNNEPLDGDEVEDFSVMLRKELDKLNGNT